MPGHMRLPATLSTQHGHEEELLGRGVDGCMGEYAACAQELQGLDLDGVGCAVEVLGEDDVGDAGGLVPGGRRLPRPRANREV